MSTIRSPVDEYGFKRPDDFDYESYEHFMSNYLRVLARRASRWKKFIKGTSKVKKSRKAKRFVRKGVPAEQRGQVWMDICGARKRKKRNPYYYKELLKTDLDELVEHSITTDIDRTFPENIHFGPSQQDLRKSLYNVLHVYALHNSRIGYCQGLNYITGLLILIVKDEESAFWLLDVLLSKRIPDYYAKDMLGLQVEQEVLSELVKLKMPELHAHIESAGLSYSIFSTKWFICLFIDVLPIETILRIWDCLFYEGSKILLRVSLTLLALHESELLAAKDFPQLCNAMKGITQTPSTMDCHSFMTNCFELPGSLPIRLIKKLRQDALKKLRPEENGNGRPT
ncbi:growth hormone-regulated TBC protein 1-A [Exaiptasia diaphana]|uniref:Growth hormone-regulated TBC protein 1 n=1 Tax=Exaiptasia diaphana TaxID=2652724 RepID=A0A913XGR7_EXADI|nr:growth hormone-regulated TBC protein 1-A [Exaiptasia diaphana]KXJ20376.1 Growth hormone-regulated TBC protein 1-A [Exaiptasia diaphana]